MLFRNGSWKVKIFENTKWSPLSSSVVSQLQRIYIFRQNLVSSEEAKRLIKRNIKVIDVRTVTEYRAGHYPRALHIPVDKIDEKTTTELPKKDYSLLQHWTKGQICSREIGELDSRKCIT